MTKDLIKTGLTVAICTAASILATTVTATIKTKLAAKTNKDNEINKARRNVFLARIAAHNARKALDEVCQRGEPLGRSTIGKAFDAHQAALTAYKTAQAALEAVSK